MRSVLAQAPSVVTHISLCGVRGCVILQGATILTIAHRINTVMDYDIVVVMDKGKVVEQGNPRSLIANSDSLYVHTHDAVDRLRCHLSCCL